jgi:hypothetical protein
LTAALISFSVWRTNQAIDSSVWAFSNLTMTDVHEHMIRTRWTKAIEEQHSRLTTRGIARMTVGGTSRSLHPLSGGHTRNSLPTGILVAARRQTAAVQTATTTTAARIASPNIRTATAGITTSSICCLLTHITSQRSRILGTALNISSLHTYIQHID